jgi:hypothetical protein
LFCPYPKGSQIIFKRERFVDCPVFHSPFRAGEKMKTICFAPTLKGVKLFLNENVLLIVLFFIHPLGQGKK